MARERRQRGSASAKGGAFEGEAGLVFPAVSPEIAPSPPPTAGPSVLVVPLLVMAVGLAIFVPSLPIRVAAPVALLLFAALLWSRRPAPRLLAQRLGPRRGVSLERGALSFHPEQGSPKVAMSLLEPFGMTLVTNPKRDRLVAVWSSASGLFYVGTSLDAASRRALAPLIMRAFTSLGDEAALPAIGPDGAPLDLSPSDFAALFFAVEELDPACVERIVASDARGAPFKLDGRELMIGDRRFDLDAPLEWRPFVFEEAFGQAIAVYQGTAIRQGGSEAVLVSLSLQPSMLPLHEGEDGMVDRAMIRDLRLMQAVAEAPPPREKRVAIDRLFVLPMRSALDRGRAASGSSSRARVRA